jgi:hypothetical protein
MRCVFVLRSQAKQLERQLAAVRAELAASQAAVAAAQGESAGRQRELAAAQKDARHKQVCCCCCALWLQGSALALCPCGLCCHSPSSVRLP